MLSGRPYAAEALIANNNPNGTLAGPGTHTSLPSALGLLVHIDLFENEASAYVDYVLPVAPGVKKGKVGQACKDGCVV